MAAAAGSPTASDALHAIKAIVLAAGRGERMRPLTDRVPKPLLRAGGRSLIEWQISRLTQAGIREIVVNVSHLGEQIMAALSDGARLGAKIEYSVEPIALETAGGIALALTKLDPGPFIAVNADIYCEFDLARLSRAVNLLRCDPTLWAHLVLVHNPDHHPDGDFALGHAGRLVPKGSSQLTFSGIGVYRPELFAAVVPGERKALGPMLHTAIEQNRVAGERYDGLWMDIGTPERLRKLRAVLDASTGGARASINRPTT
jgi:N-acetyl-alpha-D-muramate 1-phosphate uridylyltransferase